MPRSPCLVRCRGDVPGGSLLWFASAWLPGGIPARTSLTYREAKKSKNVRDEIEKGFDSEIRIFDASSARCYHVFGRWVRQWGNASGRVRTYCGLCGPQFRQSLSQSVARFGYFRASVENLQVA